MPKKLTKEIFISRSKEKHGHFYDYSMVEYKNVDTKVILICPLHGQFSQRRDHHLDGRKCKSCSTKSPTHILNQQRYKESFFRKAKVKWKDKYTYDESTYTKATGLMRIICPIHGEFWQAPFNHLKHQCLQCAALCRAIASAYSTDEFISMAKKVHGNTFSYDKTTYIQNKKPIIITCQTHGDFTQLPYNHLMGKGCHKCKLQSKNERLIESYIQSCGYEYQTQKTFPSCINPETGKKLRFDFYLPSVNTCIEYDGRQHFKPISIWGGDDALIKTKERDNIKTAFCRENGVILIRIKYTDNVVEVMDMITSEIDDLLFDQQYAANLHKSLTQ